jgi:hypothetical protein
MRSLLWDWDFERDRDAGSSGCGHRVGPSGGKRSRIAAADIFVVCLKEVEQTVAGPAFADKNRLARLNALPDRGV